MALGHCVEAARLLARAEGAAILLHDQEQGIFVPDIASGLDERWLQRQGLDAAQALALRVVQTGDLIEIPDTAAEPGYDLPLLPGGHYPGAVCAAPLTAGDTVVGVLGMYYAQPLGAPVDREVVRTFAAFAGAAIANAQAHEREQALRLRLEALDEASRLLAAELSLGAVLQRIVEVAARLVHARYAALGVAGPDGYLTEFITRGLSAEKRARIGALPRGHGLLGVLIRQGEALRVPHIARDPRRIGFPPGHPPMTSLLGVPIRVRAEVVGDLYLTDKIGAPAFSADDQHAVELLAAHAGIAIENARLYAQVGELTRLHERERIARDLHDGIIQDIYAATLQLEDLAEDTPEAALHDRALGVADRLSAVITDVRTYIQGLRARELQGRLLPEGLAALVQDVDQRGDVGVTFTLEGEPHRLPDEVANTLLHIAREALSNVSRHARATRAQINLRYDATSVSVRIGDDGVGFDPEEWHDAAHQGLRNLRTRVAELGGTLSISSQPRAGTTILIQMPSR